MIATIIADYPEQVLVTGVKKNRHCPICRIKHNKRGEFTKKAKPRTHEYTQNRIRLQRAGLTSKEDEGGVHNIYNFAWRHHHVNIHTAITVDILHQLLKGIVMRLIEWLTALIADILPKATQKRKRRGEQRTERALNEASAKARLDARFALMPNIGQLKIFKCFQRSPAMEWRQKQGDG